MSLKISVGMIVLNGNFFLKHVLDAIYPLSHAICIAEGPVKFWQDQGVQFSNDGTQQTLDDYPDPDKKLRVHYGQYAEKTSQCCAWFNMVPEDTDYILCVDSDEIHRPGNIMRLIDYLERHQPTSVGFLSNTFYGGFDHVIGGFEAEHSFKRVLKYIPGCEYLTHRQPTLCINGNAIEGRDILGKQLFDDIGFKMDHYSYVSPRQVNDKIKYYENAVIAPGKCIPNYMSNVFLPWCFRPDRRKEIEERYCGTHEFIPAIRGDAFTEPFTGQHPEQIQENMKELQGKFNNELKEFRWTQQNLF